MIRDARLDDIPALLELGALMHAESTRYAESRFMPDKLERLAGVLLAAPGGILLVAERRGRVVGFMAGMVAEHWITDAVEATDFALYVAPEARGGAVALGLLRGFEDRARALGATDLTPGVSVGIDDALAVRLYERLGYQQRGIGMWKPCATRH